MEKLFGIFEINDDKKHQIRNLYAIGDIHGDIEALLCCLMDLANVMKIDKRGDPEWIGKNDWVVFCGDYVDRNRYRKLDKGEGEISYEEEKILYIIRFLDIQARKYGGRIITIVGNHEITNLDSPGEKNFRASSTYCKTRDGRINREDKQIEDRYKRFLPGGIIHKFLYNNDKIYTIVRIGRWIFCHGGIIKKTFLLQLCDHYKCSSQDELFSKINEYSTHYFNKKNPYDGKYYSDIYSKYDKDGITPQTHLSNITWNRRWGRSSCNSSECRDLLELLSSMPTNDDNIIEPSLVIAHCVQNEGVNSCCDGRLWRLDVGMSRAFDDDIMKIQKKMRRIQINNNEAEGKEQRNIMQKSLESRKPQILKIPINNCNKSPPKIIISEKHLPRNDLRELTDQYEHMKSFLNLDYEADNVYEPKSTRILFPPEEMFENNNLEQIESYYYYAYYNMTKHKFKHQDKLFSKIYVGGRMKSNKTVRKHKGIVQTGRNKGKLKKGYKYSGKKTKTGLSIIIKVS